MEVVPATQEAPEALSLDEVNEAELVEAEIDALEDEANLEVEQTEPEEALAADLSDQGPDEDEEVFEEDEGEAGVVSEDEGEDDSSRRSKGQGKKKKDRQLEYDDRLGRVVARKKRKPSRSRGWDDDEDDWS